MCTYHQSFHAVARTRVCTMGLRKPHPSPRTETKLVATPRIVRAIIDSRLAERQKEAKREARQQRESFVRSIYECTYTVNHWGSDSAQSSVYCNIHSGPAAKYEADLKPFLSKLAQAGFKTEQLYGYLKVSLP